MSEDSPYTDSMKNKNNVTVTELVNLICELQEKKGNGDYKHSYALGTIQAILDHEVKGYNKGFRSLQETINGAYNNVKVELDSLDKGTHSSIEALWDQKERDDEYLATV